MHTPFYPESATPTQSVQHTRSVHSACSCGQALGVNQILVAVNKLDAAVPPWDQSRYEAVKAAVDPFLKQIGFKPAKVRCTDRTCVRAGLHRVHVLGVLCASCVSHCVALLRICRALSLCLCKETQLQRL